MAGCGDGTNSDGSSFAPPPKKSDGEVMQEKGYSKEEIDSRAAMPR
jgi:hypothetical protein